MCLRLGGRGRKRYKVDDLLLFEETTEFIQDYLESCHLQNIVLNVNMYKLIQKPASQRGEDLKPKCIIEFTKGSGGQNGPL